MGSKVPNPEKGARYLGQLDQALCNGNWSEVPELARKTDKHAPERGCFTLAARAEVYIASASHRPTSASSSGTSSIHSLGELVPKLRDAIVSAEKRFSEDAKVARVTLAVIHWLHEDKPAVLETLQGASSVLPGNIHASTLGWLEVCEVKATYLRGSIFQSMDREEDARRLYLATAYRTPGSRTPELRRWTERLLARACIFMDLRTSQPSLQTLSEALRCFLAWSDFWQRSSGPTSASAASLSSLDVSRREVWRKYYQLLSTILRYGLLYNIAPSSGSSLLIQPSEHVSEGQFLDARRRQRAALKRAETTYESLILNETLFPKANQSNTEVEEWVRQVIENWHSLCGPEWTDEQLGEAGKVGVGRSVLDILYRAATKTFHSTSILRYLFRVHASLGEFDLAMHAYDSYVEIVGKGQARAEKTGKQEVGFDTDDDAILTAAEAVRLLCRYGDRDQAEKALDIGKHVEQWLSRHRPTSSGKPDSDGFGHEADNNEHKASQVSYTLQPYTLAAGYRAIGVSKAHWSRFTYETDARLVLQAEALKYLRRAHDFGPDDVNTSYAQTLLLAEMRDIPGAMQVAKRTIASLNTATDEDDEDSEADAVTRRLVPLLHLLGLCLTAKEDYEAAATVCDAAIDQFGDDITFFGEQGSHDGDSEKSHARSTRGLVVGLEGFEIEGLIQLKMTRLALTELMEGPETAVDQSYELLRIYSRVFGTPQLTTRTPKPPTTATTYTPPKTGGTIRSMAGSLRPKSLRNSLENGASAAHHTSSEQPREIATARGNGPNEQGAFGSPIAITITNEDGKATHQTRHHHLHPHMPFRYKGGEHETSNLGSTRGSEDIGEKHNSPVFEGNPLAGPVDTSSDPSQVQPIHSAIEHSKSHEQYSPEQPLKEIEHNASHDTWPAAPGHEKQPPEQDVRLPAPHPASKASRHIYISSFQDQQHRNGLLVEIWLFIAGLYLRAGLFDDSAAAISEARKLVEAFEREVASTGANARTLFEKGWGGGKSVDGLWADVWAASGALSAARQLPFEAMANYEDAVSYFPDHPDAIIGLASILMDIYEEKIPAEEPRPLFTSVVPPPPSIPTSRADISAQSTSRPANPSNPSTFTTTSTKPAPSKISANSASAKMKAALHNDPLPAELNRLAARDRAYMLLTTLTRLSSGWDNAEAWLTLARAQELSGQIAKAKKALWWVVELEDSSPVRAWFESVARGGGFTL